MTSPSHGGGRRFKSGRVHHLLIFVSHDNCLGSFQGREKDQVREVRHTCIWWRDRTLSAVRCRFRQGYGERLGRTEVLKSNIIFQNGRDVTTEIRCMDVASIQILLLEKTELFLDAIRLFVPIFFRAENLCHPSIWIENALKSTIWNHCIGIF